jgi:hypothetical protein
MHPTHHGPQDYQSLLMHQEAVRMILAEPALADKALAILTRWDTQVSLHSKPFRDRWVQIIQEKNWELAVEDSELGNQLRQASPIACLLPNEVRLGIIAQVRLCAPNG